MMVFFLLLLESGNSHLSTLSNHYRHWCSIVFFAFFTFISIIFEEWCKHSRLPLPGLISGMAGINGLHRWVRKRRSGVCTGAQYPPRALGSWTSISRHIQIPVQFETSHSLLITEIKIFSLYIYQLGALICRQKLISLLNINYREINFLLHSWRACVKKILV